MLNPGTAKTFQNYAYLIFMPYMEMFSVHKEADTRLLLYVADAVNRGSRKVYVRTVDTDVIMLAITSFEKINPDELWVAFGSGASFKYISVRPSAR